MWTFAERRTPLSRRTKKCRLQEAADQPRRVVREQPAKKKRREQAEKNKKSLREVVGRAVETRRDADWKGKALGWSPAREGTTAP